MPVSVTRRVLEIGFKSRYIGYALAISFCRVKTECDSALALMKTDCMMKPFLRSQI